MLRLTVLAYVDLKPSSLEVLDGLFLLCGDNSFKLTRNIQKMKPYNAGPIPLHNPRIPVIIPWDTPWESACDFLIENGIA